MAQLNIGDGNTKEEKEFAYYELKLPVPKDKIELNAQKLNGSPSAIRPEFEEI
jgi:hypothetical protein